MALTTYDIIEPINAIEAILTKLNECTSTHDDEEEVDQDTFKELDRLAAELLERAEEITEIVSGLVVSR